MKTAWILLAQYETAVIPAERVAADYFDLTPEKFLRKVGSGEIALPLIRMERSQKAAKGVSVQDLADYIDKQRAAAVKECQQLAR